MGQIAPGNIDLQNRPRVRNADGSISTVRSIGVNFDGKEYLLPTVSDDGRIMSEDEAIKSFQRTGKHLGIFDSPEASTAYAKQLHNDQAAMIGEPSPRGTLAQVVRQKYPGVYDDLSDQELEAKVDAKYPGAYSDFERTKATPQGSTPELTLRERAMTMGMLPGMPKDPMAAAGAGAIALGAMGAGSIPGAGAALKAAGSPTGIGVLSGALKFAQTRNPIEAVRSGVDNYLLAQLGGVGANILGRGLFAKLAASRAAAAAEGVAEAAPAMAEAAPAAYQGIPSLMKIAADEVAPGAGKVAQAAGNAAGILKAPAQAMASRAATAVGEAAAPAVSATTEAAAPVVQAAEEAATPLMTRLRASVLLKQNPAQLAQEIEQKVVSLKGGVGKGLSAAQIGKTVEELYGVGTSEAKHMVKAIFDAYGF